MMLILALANLATWSSIACFYPNGGRCGMNSGLLRQLSIVQSLSSSQAGLAFLEPLETDTVIPSSAIYVGGGSAPTPHLQVTLS